MSQKGLNISEIGSMLYHVCDTAMSQCMGSRPWVYTCLLYSATEYLLNA